MKNPFIETALLISMQHVKTPEDISLIRNQPLQRTHKRTHKLHTKIIKNVLSFSLLSLSISHSHFQKIFTHTLEARKVKESERKNKDGWYT